MRIDIDAEQLRNLYVDLRKAPLRVQLGIPDTLRRKAIPLVKKAMKADARGHRYLRHLPTAVTGELIGRDMAEIGLAPRKGTQGALAHIIVYGSVNNAPVYDHTAGPRKVMPKVVDAFADMAEDAVLGGER